MGPPVTSEQYQEVVTMLARIDERTETINERLRLKADRLAKVEARQTEVEKQFAKLAGRREVQGEVAGAAKWGARVLSAGGVLGGIAAFWRWFWDSLQ